MTHDERNQAVVDELAMLRDRLARLESANARRNRLLRRAAWVGLTLVAVTGGLALASPPCANGIPFCFAADTPAQADEVNANFAALKTWIEAKVGPTGTIAAPDGNVTTNRLVSTIYVPPYTDWNAHTQGAGQAAILNDNANYKALMIAGNVAGNGATRVVKVYDTLYVNGPVIENAYEVSCAPGTNGYHFGFCCRINVRNGATECRNGTSVNFSGWGATTYPFGAASEGRYSLDCMAHVANANWPLCCRTSHTGNTMCAVSENPGALVWASATSPW